MDMRRHAKFFALDYPHSFFLACGKEGRHIFRLKSKSYQRSVHAVVSRCEHLEQRVLAGAIVDISGELMDAAVNSLGADRFVKLQPRHHAFKECAIVGADLHESRGLQLCVIPGAGDDRRPKPFEHFLADIK